MEKIMTLANLLKIARFILNKYELPVLIKEFNNIYFIYVFVYTLNFPKLIWSFDHRLASSRVLIIDFKSIDFFEYQICLLIFVPCSH